MRKKEVIFFRKIYPKKKNLLQRRGDYLVLD
jgi:hypothetical protein